MSMGGRFYNSQQFSATTFGSSAVYPRIISFTASIEMSAKSSSRLRPSLSSHKRILPIAKTSPAAAWDEEGSLSSGAENGVLNSL